MCAKYSLDKKKKALIDKIQQYDTDYLLDDLIPKSLYKMQNFLVSNGYAEKFKDIKKKCRIEIKGLAPNGGERLIGKEIREKYGMDIQEANEIFSDFYPIFNEGVIKYKSILGTHYTHFKVTFQTEKTFGLVINEYKFLHNTFYLSYSIKISEISKSIPFYVSHREGKDVRTTFFDSSIKDKVDSEFSDLERLLIKYTIENEQDAIEEFYTIFSNVISIIRSVNVLFKKYYKYRIDNVDESFYDNEFFTIKNWKYIKTDNRYSLEIEKYVDYLMNSNRTMTPLKRNTIDKVINEIVKKANIKKLYIAVGFAFQSGLRIIDKSFEIIQKNGGDCNLIIGSLQNYDDDSVKSKIDKKTVHYLNYLINNRNIKLFTYKQAFYHGKFYYLGGSEYTYIITGSSNISKTSFNNNYEMDVLYKIKTGSEDESVFIKWFNELKMLCEKIFTLNEDKFIEYNWNSELDIFQSLNKNQISIDKIRKRIAVLSDEETKFRLNLWMNHKPDVFYENVPIDAFKTYTMFGFLEKEIVVFESFVPQNAFYVFGCPHGVENLITNIKTMSKAEIIQFSKYYISRGNHVSNRENLKKRINRFFEKNSI